MSNPRPNPEKKKKDEAFAGMKRRLQQYEKEKNIVSDWKLKRPKKKKHE